MVNFILDKDAVAPGVGRVVKSIVLLIKIQRQDKDILTQKIIIPLFAVKRSLDSKRKSIVLVGTVGIVVRDGEHLNLFSKFFSLTRNAWWC